MARVGNDSNPEDNVLFPLKLLLVIAILDMSIAVLLQLCGLIALGSLGAGCTLKDVPYNAGAFVVSPFVLAASCSGLFIFYKGHSTSNLAPENFRIAVYVYAAILMCKGIGIFTGMLITGVNGICPETCLQDGNRTMAAFMMFFMALAALGAIASVVIVVFYSSVLGVSRSDLSLPTCGSGTTVSRIRINQGI